MIRDKIKAIEDDYTSATVSWRNFWKQFLLVGLKDLIIFILTIFAAIFLMWLKTAF